MFKETRKSEIGVQDSSSSSSTSHNTSTTHNHFWCALWLVKGDNVRSRDWGIRFGLKLVTGFFLNKTVRVLSSKTGLCLGFFWTNCFINFQLSEGDWEEEVFINLVADSVILKGRFRVRFVVVEISRAEGLKNWGLFNKGAGIGGLSTTIEGLDSPWIKEQGVEATFNVLRVLLYICFAILV